MKIAFFDVHAFERPLYEGVKFPFPAEWKFFDVRLRPETAVLAQGCEVVCAFTNDHMDAATLERLAGQGTRLIALRSAGYNHVDLERAAHLGIAVTRVPAYSPHAVAEHAVCLILALNRKIHKAHDRVREQNFSLDGLMGFDLYGKTVGVIGLGKIGRVFAKIMNGFGCHVLGYDLRNDCSDGEPIHFASLEEVWRRSDILSLHVPLNPATFHLINAAVIEKMKPGVMLINTGRGALIETGALIQGLKSGKIGYAGLDVYEEEEEVFFQNLSDKILQDDQLARLLTFPNVLMTSHQAFLTREALNNIVETTTQNISEYAEGKKLTHEVRFRSAG